MLSVTIEIVFFFPVGWGGGLFCIAPLFIVFELRYYVLNIVLVLLWDVRGLDFPFCFLELVVIAS